MVNVRVHNRWHLKDSEVECLKQAGKGSKINWWAKNLGSGEFFDYGSQLGGRLSGGVEFTADLEMEPGEYMFACGDWNTIDPESDRHCSQVFYILVTEDGNAQVCKKSELPSQGGNGPAQVQSQWSNSNSGWGKKPVAKKEEYFEFPSHIACYQDMLVHGETFNCEMCVRKDPAQSDSCANCSHGTPVFVKKD